MTLYVVSVWYDEFAVGVNCVFTLAGPMEVFFHGKCEDIPKNKVRDMIDDEAGS